MQNHELLRTLDDLRGPTHESATVEFKSNQRDAHRIGRCVCALANSAVLHQKQSAWLVWGVDDKTHEIKGTHYIPQSHKIGEQAVIMWLTQRINPRPDLDFHSVDHPAGRVVMLEIRAPRSAPLAFEGVRYIRIDSHNTELSKYPDIEQRLWNLLGKPNDDWSAELVPEATYDDLDPVAIEEVRLRLGSYMMAQGGGTAGEDKIRREVAGYDLATLLNKALLTRQGKLTRAALLLVGKEEAVHYLPGVDAKITWILRDSSNRTETGKHFGLPFLLAPDRVLGQIRNLVVDYLPEGTLFPVSVSKYDPWVLREALHNCIAHQDYALGGKINVVEHPDRIIFTNAGTFIPPSVEWVLDHQSPPERYRNKHLVDIMIRLRLIEQMGGGIHRMFERQRERHFPLPDYLLETQARLGPRVEVTVYGKILDVRYTHLLRKRSDLTLHQVLLLDHVQKGHKISPEAVRDLKRAGLVEGRSPNLFVSSTVSDLTAQKATYIRNRGLDDEYYEKLVLDYLRKFVRAAPRELEELLFPKLPDVLDAQQKVYKVRNLIQKMRRKGLVERTGPKMHPVWLLSDNRST